MRLLYRLLIIALAAGSLVACELEIKPEPEPAPTPTLPKCFNDPDPEFRELYDQLGGKDDNRLSDQRQL